MGSKTGITWCHSTFNPWWGCNEVSPGCDNCYARRDAHRYGHNVWGKAGDSPRRFFGAKHWNQPRVWNAAAQKSGERRRVFCASMADVGEVNSMLDSERAKLWPLIRETPYLDWLLLTKRPQSLISYLPDDWGSGYPNVWLGVTVESDQYLWRAHEIVKAPAVVHWLSIEPQIDMVHVVGLPIQWAVFGGESGSLDKIRRYSLDWLRSGIAECAADNKVVFVKQLGTALAREMGLESTTGKDPMEWPEDIRLQNFPR